MTDNVGWGTPIVDAIVAPVETQEAFLARRNHEIQSWLAHKETKDNAVELERQCRDKVTSTLFPAPKKGTQRYELSGGFKVKLVHGYTYSLGDKDLTVDGEPVPINKQVEDLQQAIHECGNQGPILADRLIRWKPELVASEYEKLDTEFADQKEIKDMIDALLTKKDSAPQLTFELPKVK